MGCVWMCGGGKARREEEEAKENVGMSRDAEIQRDVAGLLGWLSGGTVGHYLLALEFRVNYCQ